MSPADAEFIKTALIYIGTPLAGAFLLALGTHLVMVFKLPGKLDRAVNALEAEAEDRRKGDEHLEEILRDIKEILKAHSVKLSSHGERIAGLEVRSRNL